MQSTSTSFNNILHYNSMFISFWTIFFNQARNLPKKANNKDKTNWSDFSVFVREIVSTPLFCLLNFDYYALNRYCFMGQVKLAY